MSNLTFNEYLEPFENITQLLISTFIVIRLHSNLKKDQFEQIRDTINNLITVNLDLNQTKTFVSRILSSPDQYPINFILGHEQIKKELAEKKLQNDEASIVLSTEVAQCQNCGLNITNWYLYNNPPFTKLATLYTTSGIGKL